MNNKKEMPIYGDNGLLLLFFFFAAIKNVEIFHFNFPRRAFIISHLCIKYGNNRYA